MYGSYFGGGIGLLMTAAPAMMGLAVRKRGRSQEYSRGRDHITAAGAPFGGWAGALMLRRVNEKLLNLGAVAIGLALAIGLFWTAR
jgi:hypothetical protein